MTKTEVVKRLVKAGFGLPKAIEIYNKLSNYGFMKLKKASLIAISEKMVFKIIQPATEVTMAERKKVMKNAMIKRYTNKYRTFKMAPDNCFIKVYINSRLNGFIWNNDKVICVDGDEVVSSEFFK